MEGYAVRKRTGDAHERRVRSELERHGWVTDVWGQDSLPGPIRDALIASGSRWRFFPDLAAARNGEVITVDAKDRLGGTPGSRFAVKRECVSFGLQFMAAFGIPVFYVLGPQMMVLTPQDVMTYGSLGPRSHTGAYYLVGTSFARPFTVVFGKAAMAVAG